MFLRVAPCKDSAIRKIFDCGINPEYWALESGLQLKEYGIPPTNGIRNPSATDKDCP